MAGLGVGALAVAATSSGVALGSLGFVSGASGLLSGLSGAAAVPGASGAAPGPGASVFAAAALPVSPPRLFALQPQHLTPVRGVQSGEIRDVTELGISHVGSW